MAPPQVADLLVPVPYVSGMVQLHSEHTQEVPLEDQHCVICPGEEILCRNALHKIIKTKFNYVHK